MPKTNLDNFDNSEVLEALRKLGVPEEDLGITEQTEEIPADVSDDASSYVGGDVEERRRGCPNT